MTADTFVSTLKPESLIDIAQELCSANLFQTEKKIPNQHLALIGDKDLSNSGMLGIVILLLAFFLISLLISSYFYFVCVILLVVIFIAYSNADENTLHIDILPGGGENFSVSITSKGAKAENIRRDIELKVLMSSTSPTS